MNKQPVYYLQTDKRWKKLPYQVRFETATVGGSGCGPTCAAMVIQSLTGQECTPVDTCAWSVAHGYKARGQGTYYSYFQPQMAVHGIECRQMLGSRLNQRPEHPIHDEVKKAVQNGYYAIALMGPGLWTSGGHFVLVWDWDKKVRINDPASSYAQRLNGDPDRFRREVRNYWLVDARAYNQEKEDDETVTQEQWDAFMENWLARQAKEPADDWAVPHINKTASNGLMTDVGHGTIDRPKSFVTRQELAVVAANLVE